MIWVTSDWHLGHRNILSYEPSRQHFASIAEHDEAILTNVAKTVGPDDILYVLGDVCMGNVNRYANRIRDLPGTKFLVAGNHDRCWHGHSGYINQVGKYLDAGFALVNTGRWEEWPAESHLVRHSPLRPGAIFSHLPTLGESNPEREDRYREYRPTPPPDVLVVCGHVHSAWLTCGPNVNAGVDVHHLLPVPLDYLLGVKLNEAHLPLPDPCTRPDAVLGPRRGDSDPA